MQILAALALLSQSAMASLPAFVPPDTVSSYLEGPERILEMSGPADQTTCGAIYTMLLRAGLTEESTPEGSLLRAEGISSLKRADGECSTRFKFVSTEGKVLFFVDGKKVFVRMTAAPVSVFRELMIRSGLAENPDTGNVAAPLYRCDRVLCEFPFQLFD